jgi:hypothetical protein
LTNTKIKVSKVKLTGCKVVFYVLIIKELSVLAIIKLCISIS